MDGRAKIAAAITVLVLPFTPLLRMDNTRTPFLDYPLYFFTAGGLLAASFLLLTYEPWLSLFTFYVTLSSIFKWTPLSLAIAHWVALSVLLIIIFTHFNRYQRTIFKQLLTFVVVLQIIYATHQIYQYDILMLGWERNEWVQPHGTIGFHTYFAALVAIVAPIAPVALLPFLAYGVVLGKSVVAVIAFIVGVSISHKLPKWTWVSGAIVTLLATILYRQHFNLNTLASRLEAWRLGLTTQTNYLFGQGFGAWYVDIPAAQAKTGYVGVIELFLQAHNEFIQLFYEGGLIALVLVGGFLWSHRAMFMTSFGGSLVSILITSCLLFPFHITSLAVVIVAIIGMALREEKERMNA